MRIHHDVKWVVLAALLLSLFLNTAMPLCVRAQDPGKEAQGSKVVRVGWYDSTYNTIDEYGRRSGYAYEYQLKLSAYSGWTYEYVAGSWSDLLHMLENGEIDLMSDVSYTPEREKKMMFPSLPMGIEDYYIFTATGNDTISRKDPATLNGKRVGVNKDSIQADFYVNWEKDNDVHAEIIELTTPESESLQMLEDGTLDAYITVDSFTDATQAIPVFKIGSSEYYFAVSNSRPDLMVELNAALARIQEENRYYNQQMYEKYIRRVGANAFMTPSELEWLSAHQTIRVGYQDNYLALCAADEETGELTGFLKDYLIAASDCMPNAKLSFETTAFPTAEEAMNALQAGEVDCVFPTNFSGYDAEMQGMVMTPPLLDTAMYAVVRFSDPNLFAKGDQVTAAVNRGNPNYEAFLTEHFPTWESAYYNNTWECLKAVSKGSADCLLISNYRFNNIARECERLRLTTVSIGQDMDYCLGVKKGQTELYSILAKAIGMIPDSHVNAMLSRHITEDAKLTPMDFVIDHLVLLTTMIGVVIFVILMLLLQNIQAVRKAKKLILATEYDDLTGLYNRKFFFQYADRIFREHPETPMDAIVLNIEQFHSINALNGREFGDQVLKVLGEEIRLIAAGRNGIAGRFEADRFDIYCLHMEEYKSVFDRLQTKLYELAPNANIRLRMGVMPWWEKLEPVQLFDRARTACNMARGHYKEHLIIYDEKVSERESYEQRLVNDLRHALDTNEFEVFYQPKYDIRSDTPRLVSAEALVRWHHAELGMISPGDFIPLFEKNGQISLLDQFVWSEAARQTAVWRDQYGITLPVSVNLSRVDVFDPKLADTLEEILARNRLEHETLKLEVTESAYTENADQVIAVVDGLRKDGYEIEMDDFGSGYSSLNMLSSMPIDVLKMDRAFIQNIEHEEKDVQLVKLILGIAENLQVPVIAEGVETEKQLQMLKQMGCAVVQGYYFSRPLCAQEFEKLAFQSI